MPGPRSEQVPAAHQHPQTAFFPMPQPQPGAQAGMGVVVLDKEDAPQTPCTQDMSTYATTATWAVRSTIRPPPWYSYVDGLVGMVAAASLQVQAASVERLPCIGAQCRRVRGVVVLARWRASAAVVPGLTQTPGAVSPAAAAAKVVHCRRFALISCSLRSYRRAATHLCLAILETIWPW